jgi:5-methyltetrahydropteroyltriglutamate--homocysteine methyltransferase
VGLDIHSDGEFRRAFWNGAISDSFFDGFEDRGIDYARYPFLRDRQIADREEMVPQVPVVVDRLRRKRRITGDEIAFLKANSAGRFKITLPSPVMLVPTQYRPGVSDRAYPDWTAFFEHFTQLMADEVTDIVDDGVTYVQIDAPGYSRFIVPERLKSQVLDRGLDPKAELDALLAAENALLRAARRDGVTVAVHICLGTYILGPQGPLGGAGSTYEAPTVGKIIDSLEADIFLIEYSDRSGALDSLRDVPRNKIISLGLINIRDPQVERADDLMRKLEAASKFIPMERLSICPNCGFSGAAADAWVNEDTQRRKLEVMVETARRVWG